ncbi:MAG: tetratricopeptide repeat protein [Sedimentisphaerales bacterium]|nr:tetratricopeptide repeat protein [Sedimentisphaerales bacterium]
MKTLFLLTIGFAVALVAIPCLAREPLANQDLQGLYVNSIEQVLRLPPDQIDIGTAALIVSEAWSNIVAGRRYQQQLDDIALEIRSRLKGDPAKPTVAAIPVINAYLFDELKFRTVDKADDPEDLFLHSVMDRRQGYCLSLSILYLAIGERLGLPLYGVVVPGHFFVRYDDGQLRFNIETTSKGGTASDDDYIKKFNVPRDNSTIYMTNLDKLQTIGCFCNNLGNVYNDVGNIDQAMAALQCAVYINPSLGESRMNLGNIYLKKDRVDDAIAEYQAAVKINPDDAKAHNNLGNAYQKRQWLNDALNEYTSSIRLDSHFLEAYRGLALAYRKLNRLAEARTTIVQALTVEPQNAQLYCDLADAYSQSDNCNEAVPRYEKALKLKHDLAEAYLGLGSCYNKLEQSDKEIDAYLKALAINPTMFAAVANLGNAYFAKGEYNAAIEQYNKAVRLKPDDGKVYYNLGAAYSNKGDYANAVKAHLKAVELNPQMADAHYALAFAYYKLKDYDSAARHIKTAVQLGAIINPDLLSSIEHKK